MSSDTPRPNVLFVCSRNQWRSPTAEQIWRRSRIINVRSAGTSPRARRKISEPDLRWADIILVMESRHRSQILAKFGQAGRYADIRVLEIPDDYQYMDDELIALLQDRVPAVLELELE